MHVRCRSNVTSLLRSERFACPDVAPERCYVGEHDDGPAVAVAPDAEGAVTIVLVLAAALVRAEGVGVRDTAVGLGLALALAGWVAVFDIGVGEAFALPAGEVLTEEAAWSTRPIGGAGGAVPTDGTSASWRSAAPKS